MQLIFEQQIVHRPELTLGAGAFGRLRRQQRVRMHFLERVMAKRESDLLGKALEQQLDRRRRLLAVGTLKITVFDHGDRRVLRPQHMIHRAQRHAQLEELALCQRRTGATHLTS